MTDEEKKARRKLYNANRRKENPDKTKEADKLNYANRKEAAQAYRESTRTSFAIQQIVRKYNVDKELASELYYKSKETCDSCGTSWLDSRQKFRFHIDHDHNTRLVRGVLCHCCNTALGLLKEDRKKISSLLSYLKG